jgi:hypothetical protein
MPKKNIRNRIIYYFIIGFFLFGYLIYSSYELFKNFDNLVLNKDLPSNEYLSFLNFGDSSDFKPVINHSSKFRFPISLIDYKKKYTIIIYKLSDSFDNSVSNQIIVDKNYSDQKTTGIYTIVNENIFRMYYRSDTSIRSNQFKVHLSGDSIVNSMQSDSIVMYNMKFDQISWSKIPEKYLDIYIEPKNVTPFAGKIPASIAFIKRNKSLYFIMLSMNDNTANLDPRILPHVLYQ